MARTDPKTPGTRASPPSSCRATFPASISASRKEDGQQGAHICDVVFEDARIRPPACSVRKGKGFVTAMQVLERGRLHISAVCIGVADRLVELA